MPICTDKFKSYELNCIIVKKLCQKPVAPTSNPKNQPYDRRPPGTLRSGNRKSWQQAVSSKPPLVKRARFCSGEYKEFWSAVTSRKFSVGVKGSRQALRNQPPGPAYLKAVIHRPGIYCGFSFFPSSCCPVFCLPYFSNNFCCHFQVAKQIFTLLDRGKYGHGLIPPAFIRIDQYVLVCSHGGGQFFHLPLIRFLAGQEFFQLRRRFINSL